MSFETHEKQIPHSLAPVAEEKIFRTQRLGVLRQWVVSIIIGISFLIIGTMIGWMSPVLYHIKNTGKPMNLTDADVSVMTSLFYVGNVVVSIPTGYLSDWKGRKLSLLLMTIMPISSWVLAYVANHPGYLHTARLMAGFWGGAIRTVVPLYLGELVEPKIRGAVSTLGTILVNSGMLLSWVVGPYVSYGNLAVICGVIPLAFLVLIIFVPESPYWLVAQRENDKAGKNLLWLRGEKEVSRVEDEIHEIITAIEENREESKNVFMLIKSRSLRRAFVIVQVLSISQRLSGIGAVVAYMAVTLPDKKIGPLSPNECVIVTGVARLFTIFVVIVLIDRCGRIPLLITSCIGCGISMCVASLWFFFHRSTTSEFSFHWIPFAALLSYGCFFNVGLGPIPATIQGEIFPSHMKVLASGITAIVLACTSAVVNAVYIPIADRFGTYVNFIIYAVTCFTCLIFVTFFMFETKHKSLYDIQRELHNINKHRGKRVTGASSHIV